MQDVTPSTASKKQSVASKHAVDATEQSDGGVAGTTSNTEATQSITDSETLGVYTSFGELPDRYRVLFDAAGQISFFYSRSWFENLAKTTLDSDEHIRIFGLEPAGEDARPLACLVMRTPAGQKGSIFSDRKYDDRSLAGLTNFPSTFYSALVAEEVADAKPVLSRLLNRILSRTPFCTLFDLNRMDAQSPQFFDLVQAMRGQGYCVRPYKYCDMPYEPVAGMTFDDYLKHRPRDVRTEPRRRLRKLEKSHDIDFRIATDPDDIDEAIEIFERVNGASWREPEPFPDFDAGLLRAASSEGVLRFGMMNIDGETAAVQIWFVSGGIATMFKIAFDEKFKKLHVGTLLMRHMIAHVIDVEHVEEIDFGHYANPYKLRWLSKRREIWGIAAFQPKSVAGLAALLRYDGGRGLSYLKSRVKASLRSVRSRLSKSRIDKG